MMPVSIFKMNRKIEKVIDIKLVMTTSIHIELIGK